MNSEKALRNPSVSSGMRAWWVDDCDCYAGNTAAEALAAAMKDSGNSAHDYFELDEIYEAPADQMMCMGDDWKHDPERLVREVAAEMSEPGLVCSTEY